MRLERGELEVRGPFKGCYFIEASGQGPVPLTPEDLRWLCTIAGPALLNELGKSQHKPSAAPLVARKAEKSPPDLMAALKASLEKVREQHDAVKRPIVGKEATRGN